MKLTQDIIEQIPILYNELKNKAEVARRLNISTSSVNKYLTVSAAAPIVKKEENNHSKEKFRATPEIIEEINKLYSEVKNMSEVARHFNTTPTTIKRHLNEENLKINRQNYEDRDALWYYIFRLFGQHSEEKPVSDWNVTLLNRYNKAGMPYRGQLLTLKYFYEVRKNPVREDKHTIGIIQYIWDEAAEYYRKQQIKQEEITKSIQEQLERDRQEIMYVPFKNNRMRNKKRKEIDLNSLI